MKVDHDRLSGQALSTVLNLDQDERENGQTFYEAELTVNGHSKDVLMDAGGVIVEVEEQIALDLLPPTVIEGLQAQAGKDARLLKVESLTKHNKLVAYEAKVIREGKKSDAGRPGWKTAESRRIKSRV